MSPIRLIPRSSTSIGKLFSFSFGTIASASLSIVIIPVMTNLLGSADFARVTMYTLFLTLFNLIAYLGFDQAYGREYHAQKNKNILFQNSIFVPSLVALFTALVLVLFRRIVSNLLWGEYNLVSVICLACSILLYIPYRFLLLKLRMEERAMLYSAILISEKIAQLSVLIVISKIMKVSYVAAIVAAFSSLLFVVALLLLISKDSWLRRYSLNIEILRKLSQFGLPLVPLAIFTWLLSSADRVVLRIYTDYSQLGLYSAASRGVYVLGVIQSAFSTFWTPTMYKWSEEKVKTTRFENVKDTVLLFSSFVFICVALTSKIWMRILGEEYLSSIKFIPFLLFSPVLTMLGDVSAIGIAISKKTHYNNYAIIAGAILGVVAYLVLVPIMGVSGAAIANALVNTVFFVARLIVSRAVWIKMNVKNIIFVIVGLYSISIILFFELAAMLLFVPIVFVFIVQRSTIRGILSWCAARLGGR